MKKKQLIENGWEFYWLDYEFKYTDTRDTMNQVGFSFYKVHCNETIIYQK